MRKYERWMKMKLLPNLCPEEEEWPAPWPWPPPPPIAAGSNVRATLGYINILRLASFIFLNHNMRCLRQCKKGFPYLVSLGFGFEVWLSSYRWRRGGDIRRSVQVRVWRSHRLGETFLIWLWKWETFAFQFSVKRSYPPEGGLFLFVV